MWLVGGELGTTKQLGSPKDTPIEAGEVEKTEEVKGNDKESDHPTLPASGIAGDPTKKEELGRRPVVEVLPVIDPEKQQKSVAKSGKGRGKGKGRGRGHRSRVDGVAGEEGGQCSAGDQPT